MSIVKQSSSDFISLSKDIHEIRISPKLTSREKALEIFKAIKTFSKNPNVNNEELKKVNDIMNQIKMKLIQRGPHEK